MQVVKSQGSHLQGTGKKTARPAYSQAFYIHGLSSSSARNSSDLLEMSWVPAWLPVPANGSNVSTPTEPTAAFTAST